MNIKTEDYTAETIINDLKQYSIEEVLRKHSLTWKELIYIQSQKALYTPSSKKNPSHISRTKRRTYSVNKCMDKRTLNYGEYRTRREAEVIVRELKKVYWNKDKLESIKLEYGIREYNE